MNKKHLEFEICLIFEFHQQHLLNLEFKVKVS